MSDELNTLRGEINALAAETLALQTILIALLKTVQGAGLLSGAAIDGSFNNAVEFLIANQMRLGKSAALSHTAGAVRVAEDLRKAMQG